MAAIIASISNSNDVYGNLSEGTNAASKANENLTSKDISDDFLGGGSLVKGIAPGLPGVVTTLSLKDIVNSLSADITAEHNNNNVLSQWVADGMPSSNKVYGNSALKIMTPDQIQQIIVQNEADVAQQQTQYSGMTTAIANCILKIHRATDVQGLESVNSTLQCIVSPGGGGYETTNSSNGSVNQAHLQKTANNSYLTSLDGVGIYISW